MKDLYFFDDKGISTLVKAIIKKLFESPNYINMRKQISSLREDIDKASTSSNEVIECKGTKTGPYDWTFEYPPGFDYTNTLIVGNRGVPSDKSNSQFAHIINITTAATRISVVTDQAQTGINYHDLYLYVMKVKSFNS